MPDKNRRDTTLHIRVPDEIRKRLLVESDARMLSVNFLVNHAIREFLDNIVPVDEFRLTRND